MYTYMCTHVYVCMYASYILYIIYVCMSCVCAPSPNYRLQLAVLSGAVLPSVNQSNVPHVPICSTDLHTLHQVLLQKTCLIILDQVQHVLI